MYLYLRRGRTNAFYIFMRKLSVLLTFNTLWSFTVRICRNVSFKLQIYKRWNQDLSEYSTVLQVLKIIAIYAKYWSEQCRRNWKDGKRIPRMLKVWKKFYPLVRIYHFSLSVLFPFVEPENLLISGKIVDVSIAQRSLIFFADRISQNQRSEPIILDANRNNHSPQRTP